jgi:hypothetical protein
VQDWWEGEEESNEWAPDGAIPTDSLFRKRKAKGLPEGIHLSIKQKPYTHHERTRSFQKTWKIWVQVICELFSMRKDTLYLARDARGRAPNVVDEIVSRKSKRGGETARICLVGSHHKTSMWIEATEDPPKDEALPRSRHLWWSRPIEPKGTCSHKRCPTKTLESSCHFAI